MKQREQRPLVVIVFVVGTRPSALEVTEKTGDFGVEAADVLGDSTPQPVGVTKVSNFECSDLSKEPRNYHSNGSWHNQPRWSAEGRFSKCDQSGRNVAGLCLSKWFDCAYVSGKEGKHGDSDSSLPWQAKEWELKQLRRGALVVAWRPEAVVPCSAQMCDNDPEGSNSSDTLSRLDEECGRGCSDTYLHPRHVLAGSGSHLASRRSRVGRR